ncbi:MAG: S9 family peptidase [Bacteroidaceae bacterium]|nr:S9 family peptidase [Bacteroidaceae bacterium]
MQIPLEDFFRNSPETAFQLSPDGQHIAYLAPWRDRMNIFVRDTDKNNETSIQLTHETERSVGGFMWKGNDSILFVKDVGGDENYQLFSANIDGSHLRSYTNFPGVRTSLIDDLEDTPNEVLIALNRRNPEIFDAYRLNLTSGDLKLIAENPGNIQGWMPDREGRLRVATAIVDGVNTQILYRDTEEEAFRPVLTTNFKESVDFITFLPHSNEVLATTNLGRDRTALVRMDAPTCSELEVIYEHPRYDISSIDYSKKQERLLCVSVTGHTKPERNYLDETFRAFRERIEAFFPNQRVGIADCDKAEEQFLIYVGSDRTRGAYYFYRDGQAPRLIAQLAPWLNEEEMGSMYGITYDARDGQPIEAYLTLPHGYTPDTAHQLPVVVNPHGGPWARDVWGWNSETQFLANRGYAVLQMNFRSSTGYGRAFMEAGYKQWGGRVMDDINDGTKYLIAQGIADPKRIAIYGGSFGGYAALAGITFTPDLYACAVDYVGVSNLFTFMQTIPPYWRPLLDMLHEQVGDPEADHDILEATSPALHADRICVPLFIAQGANDPRVNKAESDQMVAALQARGIDVEYMVKDNEGHGFSNQENRFDFYRAMERFLARHLQKH